MYYLINAVWVATHIESCCTYPCIIYVHYWWPIRLVCIEADLAWDVGGVGAAGSRPRQSAWCPATEQECGRGWGRSRLGCRPPAPEEKGLKRWVCPWSATQPYAHTHTHSPLGGVIPQWEVSSSGSPASVHSPTFVFTSPFYFIEHQLKATHIRTFKNSSL